MPTKLTLTGIDEGSLCGKGSNPKSDVALFKTHSGVIMNLEAILKALPEDQRKTVEKALADEKAKIVELEKQIKAKDVEIAKAKPAPTDEEVLKSLPESVRKELLDNRKKTEDLTKALETEQDIRLTNEFVEKARKDYPNLTEKPEVIGAVLKSVSKHDKDAATKLETVLKAANAAAKMGEDLKKELGRNNPAEIENSAIAQLNKIARELVKTNVVKTFEMGFLKACEQRPDLYKLSDSERES